ncbi:uncharacterized protein LOC131443402 isoform X3 [Solea solea]|nr:uncharacterized protein LOC131443402 isoform X3 [Solea solea]
MLAVSVDGNRKHYRFKNASRSEEQAIFQGVFIAKDEDVATFVDHIHRTSKHVSGRGVCGGEWSAARETSQRSTSKVDEEGLELAVCRHGVLLRALNMYRGEMFAYPLYLQEKLASRQITFFCMDVTCKYWPYLQKVAKSCPELQPLLSMKPFLSVFHAKAHDFKCEVKWSGAYQEGAGLTLGEEVEQCNAFLSRIAVTTKHMSKAGHTDMLTLLAMRWNQQKFDNLATSLSHRYHKTIKSLQSKQQNLESMKAQLAVTESHLEDWVSDVKEWAEDSVDLRTKRKAFDIIMAVRRLEEEKNILVLEMDHHWKWLSTRAKTSQELSSLLSSETVKNWPCGFSEEGLKGLQSIILRKQQNIREKKMQARDCYLRLLSGETAENMSFLHKLDDSDSDSDSSDDAL